MFLQTVEVFICASLKVRALSSRPLKRILLDFLGMRNLDLIRDVAFRF